MTQKILTLAFVLASFTAAAEQPMIEGTKDFAQRAMLQTQAYIANLENNSKFVDTGDLHAIHQHELALLDAAKSVHSPSWSK